MGWNGSSETGGGQAAPRGARRNAPPSKWHGLAALLIVVAAGGLAAWLFMGGNDKTKEARDGMRPSQIAEVKPQIPTNQVAEAKDAPAKERDAEIRQRREMLKKMTPDQKIEFLFEQAKKRPLPEAPSTNRIFRTGLEQVMDWVFTCELGDPPPPLPEMSMFDEAHLAEILIMDNPVKDSDSDDVRDSKETVQMAKKEFINFIKEGGDPYDFLPYYHGQLVQAHNEFMTSRRAMIETVKNDPDIAPEFIKKVNNDLAAKGIKKIALPAKMLEKYNVQLED